MTPELYYIIIINVLVLIAGYLLGKNDIISIKTHQKNTGTSVEYANNKKNEKPNKKTNSNKITIDETKVVTKIITDNLEKKYVDLAGYNESDENISSAINKLKNIKS